MALSTTRTGGVSDAPFASFNLAHHVGDQPDAVAANRHTLSQSLPTGTRVQWLQQVHGTRVLQASQRTCGDYPEADASVTRSSRTACAVLTADCLPVLLCDRAGSTVTGATISDLVLKAGLSGIAIEWYKDLASANSSFAPSTEDVDGFLHNFLTRLVTSTVENAERANELKNGRFVMVYETKYKGVDSLDAFKVAGWESGLKLSEMTFNTLENSGSTLFTLATEEGDVEQYPYQVFLEVDYATSKATFDSLFATP